MSNCVCVCIYVCVCESIISQVSTGNRMCLNFTWFWALCFLETAISCSLSYGTMTPQESNVVLSHYLPHPMPLTFYGLVLLPLKVISLVVIITGWFLCGSSGMWVISVGCNYICKLYMSYKLFTTGLEPNAWREKKKCL